MTEPTLWLPWALIAQPGLWALVTLGRSRPPPAWLAAGVVLQALLAMALLEAVWSGGAYELLLSDELGIGLRVDGVALLFVALSVIVGSAAVAQCHLYFRLHGLAPPLLWPLLWSLWGGLNLIWLARDFLLVYLGMEVVAVSVVGLIALDARAGALKAAMRYLQAVLLGTLALLLGGGVLQLATGSFSIALADTQGQGSGLATALIVAGLVYRAALFPLHTWLPPAHGNAHAPLSALLSALVTKASFYVLARYWLENQPLPGQSLVALLLGMLGALAILWGGWMALRQQTLKMLVAYSSVNQIGYFFLLFPLLAGAGAEVMVLSRDGALLQVISHALAKAALFMAAGNLALLVGSGLVTGVQGLARLMPLSLVSFGLASVSIMGLPPSGGFMAKWYLLQASLQGGQWGWALVLSLGGLLSAAYVFRVLRLSYLEAPQERAGQPVGLALEVVPLILALMAAGFGLFTLWPMELASLATSDAPHVR